jgi:uncharacterized protein (TIGR00290 family)
LSKGVVVSWSGGKDCSLALDRLLAAGGYEVQALVTTFTEEFDRISMHGVRRSLLNAQAASLGFPIDEVWIPAGASNEVYEARMKAVLLKHRERGVEEVAFGDLFLQDIRDYREARLAQIGMRGLFPLWGLDTRVLASELVNRGFRAVVCCVDPRRLGKEFCGREFDRPFLQSIPSDVDPCGENGEFHTFVYAGPIFKQEIGVTGGEVVLRDGFYFADLLPGG